MIEMNVKFLTKLKYINFKLYNSIKPQKVKEFSYLFDRSNREMQYEAIIMCH